MQQWGPRAAVIVVGVLVGLGAGFAVGAGFEWPSEEELAEARARLDAANATEDPPEEGAACASLMRRLEDRRQRARLELGLASDPALDGAGGVVPEVP